MNSVSRRRFLGTLSAGASTLAWASGLRAQSAPAARKKIGVVLCGLGNYAKNELLPALKETEFCRLVGVVTGSREKGLTWAAEHGFPEKNIWSYDTMHQMADAREVDAVYVVTPNSLHAEHSIRASKAGKHVICEKPMAISVAECDAMLAAAKAAGRSLAIGYRLHYDPYHQELVRLAQTKEFGPFMTMKGGFAFIMKKKVWRAERALSGGGPIMDLGIYALHEACFAADADPIAVVGREPPKTRPEFFTDVDETLEWTMEFANGAKAELFTSYNAPMNSFRADAAKGWFEISPAYSYRGLKAATSKGPLSFPPLRQQARHLDAIGQALLEGRPVPTPGELGRRDMVIIEGVYASAKSGQRVVLKY